MSAAPSMLLNDEQQMLSKTAHEFVARRAPAGRLRSFRDAGDQDGFSRELWSEMADLGWLGLQIPQEYDGLGLGFFDLCVVLEAAGRELMPEPLVSTLLLGTQAVLLGGSDAQKRAILPAVASGQAWVAVGYEESGVRGDIRKVQTTAVATPDGFELSGEKVQVLDAHVAHHLVVSAKTEDGTISLFVVDPQSSGVSVTRQHRIDGQNAAIVTLDRCAVSEGALLGPRGEGVALLTHVLDRAAVGLSAHMLGAAEQAFEDTLAYLKEREQFDAPIGSFQALQHRAVDLYTELALLRSAVLAAARAVDEEPEDLAKRSTLANALASETFLHVAKEAIQMHGGIGVTDEHDIGLYIKRAQATYMTFGDPAQQRRRWADIHGY